jgi:hypothetical protein
VRNKYRETHGSIENESLQTRINSGLDEQLNPAREVKMCTELYSSFKSLLLQSGSSTYIWKIN